MSRSAWSLLAFVGLAGCTAGPRESFWPLLKQLERGRWVDLTHAFRPGIPKWQGFPDGIVQEIHSYEKDGFRAERFSLVGQYGTHCDPPAHFHRELRTIDQIPVREMILPMVVIDVHEQAARNADFMLTAEHVKAWEAENGPIPRGAFVAMRTDWSKRWPSQEAMQNRDAAGVAHYPGWTLGALKYLYETRGIAASGHETTDTDPGVATSRGDYSCESYVLGRDRYQIELLTNLDQVPPTGAIAVVTFPKPDRGSGFPARAFAIWPKQAQ